MDARSKVLAPECPPRETATSVPGGNQFERVRVENSKTAAMAPRSKPEQSFVKAKLSNALNTNTDQVQKNPQIYIPRRGCKYVRSILTLRAVQ